MSGETNVQALRLAILIAISSAAWADEARIADCLSIEGRSDRLACYDELARAYLDQAGRQATPAPSQSVSPDPEPAEDDFGKPSKNKKARQSVPQFTARIESVRKAARGNYVMTLNNGQVWAENEPNKRPIEGGQDVTIIKRRFNYLMRLESGRNVAVSRIDDN